MTRISVVALAFVATAMRGDAGSAQIPPYAPDDELIEASFEVASVRENHLSQREAIRAFIRMQPSGHFDATWVTLRSLIILAYGVRDTQIADAPEWIDRARFDIVAKAPDNFQLRHARAMIRRLLEDRFGLRARKAMRRTPVYALDWADRRGRQLGRGIRPPSTACDPEFTTAAGGLSSTGAPPASIDPSECRPVSGFGDGRIFVRRAPIASFITFLEGETDRPVIDRTGLAGVYDVDLKWSPRSRLDRSRPGDSGAVDNGPSIYTAVREQLGLKLEPVDGEREVLTILRVERPLPD